MKESITLLVCCVLLFGMMFPVPPGILGALMHWYIFGGKREYEDEVRKWERLEEIKKELEKEGKTLHDEMKLAREGKSKYFKTL